jgi:hypothetical protein
MHTEPTTVAYINSYESLNYKAQSEFYDEEAVRQARWTPRAVTPETRRLENHHVVRR